MKESSNSFYAKLIFIEGVVKYGKKNSGSRNRQEEAIWSLHNDNFGHMDGAGLNLDRGARVNKPRARYGEIYWDKQIIRSQLMYFLETLTFLARLR